MKTSLFKSYSRTELESKILLRQLLYIFIKTTVTLIIPLYTIIYLKIDNFFVIVMVILMSSYLYFHFLPYRKVNYARAIGFLALHCNIFFLVKMMDLSKTFGFIEELVCVLLIGIWVLKETYIYRNFKRRFFKKGQLNDNEIRFDGLLLRRIKENIYELAPANNFDDNSDSERPKILFEVKECIVGDVDTFLQSPPVVSIKRRIRLLNGHEAVDSGIQYYFYQNVNEISKDEILLTSLVKDKEIAVKCD